MTWLMRLLTSKIASSRSRISLQQGMLNSRPNMRRFKASSRSVTMIKETRSSKILNKNSTYLRKEMSDLSHRVLLPSSIPVIKPELESITCLSSMSGFRLVTNFSKTLILDTQSRHQSTLTWSREKTCQRSKAYKLRRLQCSFRPNLRQYSLDQSTSNSIPPRLLLIWRSQTTLRVSKTCWLPNLFASKTSGPTQRTLFCRATTKWRQ